MAKKISDNRYSGIKAYTEQKNRDAVTKAEYALEEMEQFGERITFDGVAKRAGIARSTLYCNPEISLRIKNMRTTIKGVPREKNEEQTLNNTIVSREQIEKQKLEIQKLKQDRKLLLEQKKALIVQLVQMENIIEENKYLKKKLMKGR